MVLPCVKRKVFNQDVFRLYPLFATSIVFLYAFGILNRASQYATETIPGFESPSLYPISHISSRVPTLLSVVIALGLIGLFPRVVRYVEQSSYNLRVVIVTGLLLALGTTLMHGWDNGFGVPIAGECDLSGCIITPDGGHQYYHDLNKVVSIDHFLSHFDEIFPELGGHTRNHPPGALFAIRLLDAITPSPHFISLIIAAFALPTTAYCLYKILQLLIDDGQIARYAVFIFLLIPSTQIYFVSSVDALITAFTIGFLYFFLRPQRHWTTYAGLIACGFLASFLNFTFALSFGVAFGYDVLVRRDFRRSLIAMAGIGLVYVLILLMYDYNYVTAFKMAVDNENAYGNPVNDGAVPYIITRLESIFDIFVYFGPLLVLLVLLGLRHLKRISVQLWWLSLLNAGVFALTLLVGFYRTGETSRSNMFMWIFFLFPAFVYLQSIDVSDRQLRRLYWFLFGQTVFMQFFGFYFY